MPRPNISLTAIVDILELCPGNTADFNDILASFPFSEVTLRTGLKRLLFEGNVIVDRNTKPYTYQLVEPLEGKS